MVQVWIGEHLLLRESALALKKAMLIRWRLLHESTASSDSCFFLSRCGVREDRQKTGGKTREPRFLHSGKIVLECYEMNVSLRQGIGSN